MIKEKIPAYAIVRYDESESPKDSFTVKEIVSSLELAEKEVDRLNKLNSHLKCKYWWLPTRIYPNGSASSS